MPVQIIIARSILSAMLFGVLIFAPAVYGQQSKAAGSAEWDKLVDAAKKEGKVTVSLPASAELKKQIEEQFKKRYGIEVETFTSRGSTGVRRMADEFKAGVRHFDLHIGGSSSIISGMLDEGILDPIEPWLALPEVKDPKQWWGGHLWVDNAKRFVYTFQAYLSEIIWYNTELVKPNEIRSFDDFLNPKWKGKIGYLDPRTPGAGDSTWSFMWQVKGEEYLKKLVAQDLYLGRDQRLLAESLAKGRVAVMIGNSYYSYSAVSQSGVADQTPADTQRGKLRHRRQRQSGDHQSAGAPEQHQGFRQLAVGPRGTGDRFPSARSSDPAPRCRYPLSERIRHNRGERRDVGQ